MSKPLIFVDHELRDGHIRVKDSRLVARHIGTHYRNRSKPSRKPWTITVPRHGPSSADSRRKRPKQKTLEDRIMQGVRERLWTVGHHVIVFDNSRVYIWVKETKKEDYPCPKHSNQTVARPEPPMSGFLPSQPSVASDCLVGRDDIPKCSREVPTEDSERMLQNRSSTETHPTCASYGRGGAWGPGKALGSIISFPYPSKHKASAELGLDFGKNSTHNQKGSH